MITLIERNVTIPLFSIILILTLCSLSSCSSVYDDLDAEMVSVPAGDFYMGSEETNADPDEYPRHKVYVDSFQLCSKEVSQKLWKKVMGRNPSYHRGRDLPVEAITFNEAMCFIEELNKRTGITYRLPSEIEWEYAASFEKMDCDMRDVAWFASNSEGRSHPCGSKAPNGLGVFDMLGNVNEWVNGIYRGTDYTGKVVSSIDTTLNEVVFRGGAFNADLKYCRISNRNHISPDVRNYAIGLRLAK